MHILLGMKEADSRLSLELLLSEEPGVTVIGEASETEGLLALIHTSQPDLVILEQDLPGRPVADLLADIRGLADPPRLIVQSKELRAKSTILEAGADAIVIQGDPPDKLLATFRRVIKQ